MAFSVSLQEGKSGDRIVGGQIAGPHSIPFQVALLVFRGSKDVVLCGGSIVNKKAVLTAAHCLKNSKKALIFLGGHNLIKNETGTEKQLLNPSNFKIHPNFNIRRADSDVAVVLLSTPVTFSGIIQPVKLLSGFLLDEKFSGELGTVSGFGQYCDNCGSSNVLRYTQNLIISNDECSTSFSSPSIPSENHICLNTKITMSGSCHGVDTYNFFYLISNNIFFAM